MKTVVVGVSGGIGSGKSSFVRRLAEELGCSTVSFGNYVRAKATELGRDHARETLQQLGEELLERLGALEFAREVMSPWMRSNSLVVDGVRHIEVADAIRNAAGPIPFRLVYLDVPQGTREERLAAVRPTDARNLASLETHSTEQHVVSGLRERAAIVLTQGASVEELVREALARLRLSGIEARNSL